MPDLNDAHHRGVSPPLELRERPQWVCWRYGPTRSGRPKRAKVPMRADGRGPASTTDPRTWCSYDVAAEVALAKFDGCGYVFSPDDPFTGIDLDGCITPDGLSAQARGWLERLATYAEISPSGSGVKAIVRAVVGVGGRNDELGLEIYDRGRFFTMTGQRLTSFPESIADGQDAVDAFLAQHFTSNCTQRPARRQAVSAERHPLRPGAHVWAKRALEEECQRVAVAQEGERRKTARIAGLRIGRLVNGGYLEEENAATRLVEAAQATGLPTAEAEDVVADGLAHAATYCLQQHNNTASSSGCTSNPQWTPDEVRASILTALEGQWATSNADAVAIVIRAIAEAHQGHPFPLAKRYVADLCSRLGRSMDESTAYRGIQRSGLVRDVDETRRWQRSGFKAKLYVLVTAAQPARRAASETPQPMCDQATSNNTNSESTVAAATIAVQNRNRVERGVSRQAKACQV